MLKVKIHSFVDLITNSSTTIYTYQNSVKQAKELVNEVLKLQGITDKTPEDIFYYGVFCEDDVYSEYLYENYDDITTEHPEIPDKDDDFYKYISDLKLSVLKCEVDEPDWFGYAKSNDDGWSSWSPDTILYLLPKDDKYKELAQSIKSLLNSIDADGGRDE